MKAATEHINSNKNIFLVSHLSSVFTPTMIPSQILLSLVFSR